MQDNTKNRGIGLMLMDTETYVDLRGHEVQDEKM